MAECPPPRKRRCPDAPLGDAMHQAVGRVGIDTSDPPAADPVAACTALLRSGGEEAAACFASAFAGFASSAAHKVPEFAGLLEAAAAAAPAAAQRAADAAAQRLLEAFGRNDWVTARQLLRLFGWMRQAGTATGPATPFHEQLAEQLAGCTATEGGFVAGDAVAHTLLATLPWCGRGAASDVRGAVEGYFARRERSQALLVRRAREAQEHNFMQDPSALPANRGDEPDHLEALCWHVLAGEDPEPLLKLPRGGAGGGAGGAAVKVEAELPRVSAGGGGGGGSGVFVAPDVPAFLRLFGEWTGRPGALRPVRDDFSAEGGAAGGALDAADEHLLSQRDAAPLVDRAVAQQAALDLVYAFSSDLPLLLRALHDLPRRAGTPKAAVASWAVEAIFGSALAARPVLPRGFYSALLAGLVGAVGSPFALPVVEAFEVLQEQVVAFDANAAMALQELFAAHVAAHELRWNWPAVRAMDEGAKGDFRPRACRRLFRLEMMHKFIALVPKELLMESIPPYIDTAKLLQREEVFRFGYKAPGTRWKPDADKLLRQLRQNERLGAEEVLGHLRAMDDKEGPATGAEQTDVLLNCLLLLGADSFAHEAYLLRGHAEVLRAIDADGEDRVRSVQKFWESRPHRGLASTRLLVQVGLAVPGDAVAVAFDAAKDFERSTVWEPVYATLDVQADRIWRAVEEIVDSEGAAKELNALQASAAAKAAAAKHLASRAAQLEAEVGVVLLPELRQAVRRALEGLVEHLVEFKQKELEAMLARTEREKQAGALKSFLWSRAVFAHFNALGLRYLTFILPEIDTLYEEVLISKKAPPVLHHIMLSWRLARFNRAMPVRGSTVVLEAQSGLQQEVQRRLASWGRRGETIFDRIEHGSYNPMSGLA